MEQFITYSSFVCYGLIVLATILFLCFYARRLSWWNGYKKPQQRFKNEKLNKLAIIVPARNESKAIGELLNTIKVQTYDKKNFDLVVVVKEEDDPTINMVEEVGGICYVDKEQNNKGHALNYALQHLLVDYKDTYDAFVFVDADCELDKKYLEEVNNALAHGDQIINSRLVVKNYLIKGHKGNTWASRCNGLIWPIMNEMGNRKKADLGIAQFTLGTGLVITSDLIELWNGWPFCKTMTEDGELAREAAINGWKTFYYEYAICYVEEAKSLHITNIRRQRWMEGVVACDRLYNKDIKKKGTRQAYLDWYSFHNLYYTYAYYGFLFLMTVYGVALSLFAWFSQNAYISWMGVLVPVTCFFIVYFSYLILAWCATLAGNEYINTHRINKVLIVISAPFFYMWYVKVMAIALFWRKSKKWKEIKRVDFNRGKRREIVHKNENE